MASAGAEAQEDSRESISVLSLSNERLRSPVSKEPAWHREVPGRSGSRAPASVDPRSTQVGPVRVVGQGAVPPAFDVTLNPATPKK